MEASVSAFWVVLDAVECTVHLFLWDFLCLEVSLRAAQTFSVVLWSVVGRMLYQDIAQGE